MKTTPKIARLQTSDNKLQLINPWNRNKIKGVNVPAISKKIAALSKMRKTFLAFVKNNPWKSVDITYIRISETPKIITLVIFTAPLFLVMITSKTNPTILRTAPIPCVILLHICSRRMIFLCFIECAFSIAPIVILNGNDYGLLNIPYSKSYNYHAILNITEQSIL